MFLQAVTLAVITLFAVFIYFQVIQPLIMGTPLFPFFSEREKVEGEIDQELETIDVQKDKKKLNQLKEESSKEQKDEELS